jgi:hypothetical protein
MTQNKKMKLKHKKKKKNNGCRGYIAHQAGRRKKKQYKKL